jgi:UDP-N-acetylmuramoyl-L-alanyl-D-glutamate--2,6-diaminopimelate ligase
MSNLSSTGITLEALIAHTGIISVTGSPKGEVKGLSHDSRTISPGDLFFALPGLLENGRIFVNQAVERGALAVVTQEEIGGLPIPSIRVENARSSMADLSAAYYGSPSRSLAVAGVTGTNGKTTTSWIIRHLCDAVGRACGLIGTIEYVLPGFTEAAWRTTPESSELQQMLARMRDGGFRAASLEVSSHALVQQRVRGVEFDAAIFTNLSQEHLDYHGTMEEYFAAKALLFSQLASQKVKKGRAIINADDRYGHRLIDRVSGVPVITYGQGSNCDFRASDIAFSATGTIFRLDAQGRSYLVRTPLIGLFNVYNTLAALAAGSGMGIELRRAVKAAATIPQVPGRLQRVPGKKNFQAFVDYAHTPDALENVLKSLRQLQPARIITVFGCGGDRDRSKRAPMAEVAERNSEHVIITSDNPRSEDPLSIIREVEKGLHRKGHESFVGREIAIRRAVELSGPGDIILIAGKGHESYQETSAGRTPFDDVSVTASAMASKMTGEVRSR